ncbi:MAG: helix-turn-helix domain-containing protein [Gammaproteobacteria bacterium]|nr:helix-turn-helix domain-containing protein [Gammaproteobacteria bacterium]
MNKGTITMSLRDVSRLEVIQKVRSKQLSVKEAGSLLGVSERQIKRLTRAYREEGAQGLISKHRGKAGNNRIEGSLDLFGN